MQVLDRPSPNHTERRNGASPSIVVLHYTAMESAESAVNRLCDQASQVSAHYLIDSDGTIIRMVAEERRAWHAGASNWGGTKDVNSHSIGIELSHPGHHGGHPPFPHPQMLALEQLLRGLQQRWSIQPDRFVGHACVAPGRKIDPGEKFDWRRLALQQLAVWHPFSQSGESNDHDADAGHFQDAARKIGYMVPCTGVWCDDTCNVWHAFAMRFLPQLANESPFPAGVEHAKRIAELWPCKDPDDL